MGIGRKYFVRQLQELQFLSGSMEIQVVQTSLTGQVILPGKDRIAVLFSQSSHKEKANDGRGTLKKKLSKHLKTNQILKLKLGNN